MSGTERVNLPLGPLRTVAGRRHFAAPASDWVLGKFRERKWVEKTVRRVGGAIPPPAGAASDGAEAAPAGSGSSHRP